MKPATVLSFTVAAAVNCVAAHGNDPFEQWQGPKAGDVRGPCPFLNAFANHGFLPRSGKYITQRDLIDGLAEAANFDEGLSNLLYDFAVGTNPEPNSTWFSLDHLTRHNILEHDASLSRVDNYFGHADVLDRKVFDETRSYWGHGDTINAVNGAAAIVGRMSASNRTNPEFAMSDLGFAFTIGETAAFISILGDRTTLTVNKRLVEYLFENERLPTELGWKRPDTAFTQQELFANAEKILIEYERRLNSTSRSKRSVRFKGLMGHGVPLF
ncbi:putative sterigmatocystin biosynthesis peroxidase stcC [Madurella mycetomatis]|uniref:Putative sterigmatocystin biosynthesis peroxidase stcC n=1 Tax=Madurella mycetomatis TaxID=100816 RepID=A0A175VYS0_9PEZI|nr:putative sterigmatocystin biosynthesis peroxidase stcC [Madurella mycetomatis]KXX76150.1 putative sterigmatocystin biosynthesis peroxidase stcC [Madurella mycetomatis]